ncbi:MAG: hypothetical protein PHE55_01055 [Methylococcaceae bacterium]|nr:hypothetical protein [Methylococcaceae bacterium]
MEKAPARINDVSERLCVEFKRVLPLQPSKHGKNISGQDIQSASEAALQKFYETARIERQRHRLGVIGRARVAFGLQQRLLAAGYPSQLVKQVLFALLMSAFVGDPR